MKQESYRLFKTQKGINKAAKICLENKLYVKGWMMQRTLSDPDNIEFIEIAEKDGKIAGCLIKKKDCINDHNIEVYVKTDFRRKRIGSHLIERARQETPDLWASCGIRGSVSFFRSNGIEVD